MFFWSVRICTRIWIIKVCRILSKYGVIFLIYLKILKCIRHSWRVINCENHRNRKNYVSETREVCQRASINQADSFLDILTLISHHMVYGWPIKQCFLTWNNPHFRAILFKKGNWEFNLWKIRKSKITYWHNFSDFLKKWIKKV